MVPLYKKITGLANPLVLVVQTLESIEAIAIIKLINGTFTDVSASFHKINVD
jgi:hypothetical protein